MDGLKQHLNLLALYFLGQLQRVALVALLPLRHNIFMLL